ncbi:hypothetical protein DEJ35_02225 [Curtobacterium sp. MCPF17_051]|nr:hypothetical protein DEJ35_02225 [Curtobacterium sp. MCPF17_051]
MGRGRVVGSRRRGRRGASICDRSAGGGRHVVTGRRGRSTGWTRPPGGPVRVRGPVAGLQAVATPRWVVVVWSGVVAAGGAERRSATARRAGDDMS